MKPFRPLLFAFLILLRHVRFPISRSLIPVTPSERCSVEIYHVFLSFSCVILHVSPTTHFFEHYRILELPSCSLAFLPPLYPSKFIIAYFAATHKLCMRMIIALRIIPLAVHGVALAFNSYRWRPYFRSARASRGRVLTCCLVYWSSARRSWSILKIPRLVPDSTCNHRLPSIFWHEARKTEVREQVPCTFQ